MIQKIKMFLSFKLFNVVLLCTMLCDDSMFNEFGFFVGYFLT